MEKYINKISKIQELLKQSEQQQAEEKLQELKEEIIYDIALKNNKGSNNKEQLKYAKLLLRNAKKDTGRPLTHKMYKIDDTYQILDGYVAIVLKDPIVGLELNTNEEQYFDCRRVVKTLSGNYVEYDDDYKEVDIDLLELEKLALKAKKYKEPPYPMEVLGHNYNIYYHPLRLLTAIKILGTKNVKVYFHTRKKTAPIYLKSDFGESIVLPIRVPKEKEK